MIKFDIDIKALRNILNVNLSLKPGESVLLLNDVLAADDWQVADDKLYDFLKRSIMVRQVYDFYRSEYNNIAYITYTSTGQHGSEPPAFAAEKMQEYDIILAITTYSITHTNAREKASDRGARIASMPGLEPEMLKENGPMAVDYNKVCEETMKLAELVDKASKVRIESPTGTNLSFSIESRSGQADTGILSQKGQWGNLPAGEAFTAPVEGTAQGKLVVPAGWYEGLEETMVIDFTDGYVSALKGGGKVGEQFKKLLQLDSNNYMHRRNCAELGIGTNPLAKDAGNTLEAEKIRGTVHIAIGDSSHFGGQTESDLHEDFVIPEPTLYLDESQVLARGVLTI